MRQTTVFIALFFLSCLVDAQSTFKPSDISGLKLWLKADSGVVYDPVTFKVSSWKDISFNGNDAIQASVPSQPVFVDSISQLNYEPVIRFDGTAPYLQFSEINDVRHVFFVIKEDADATSNARALLGHSSSYHFHRGDNKEFWRTVSASPFVKDGTLRVGPGTVNGTTTTVPTEYSLISIETTGNVSASNFSWDQNYSTRFWDGDLAELIIYNQPLTTSLRQQVEEYLRYKYASPSVSLGTDITIATGYCPQTLGTSSNFTEFLWSTGSTTSSISVDTSGEYSIQAKDIFGFWSYDTIQVIYPSLNQPSINTTICSGSVLKWDTELPKTDYTFQWQDGSSDSLFSITQAGQYYVKVTDLSTCFINSTTVTVTVDPFPTIASLGPDLSLCSGNSIALTQGADLATTYLWSTGATSATVTILISGQYSLTVSNANNCIKQDTINVTIVGAAPTADFSSSLTCKNDLMNFIDLSSPPGGNTIVNWEWFFGDTQSSIDQNPAHLYGDSGVYNAMLKVTTNVNCVQTITKPVRVYALPEAEYKNIALSCSAANTLFTDSSTFHQADNPITKWFWDFNDGSPLDTNSVTQHTFNDTGNYQVKLLVRTTVGCEDSIIKTLNVKPSPTVNFTSSTACENQPVYFSNQTAGALSYLWDFLSTTSVLEAPSFIYADTGIYSVSLTAFSAEGCRQSLIQSVSVNPTPSANFSYIKNCSGIAAEFTDISVISAGLIDKWNWDFASLASSVVQNPSHIFSSASTYSVMLVAGSSENCYDTIIKQLQINPLPVPNFTFTPVFGDPPLTVNFTNLSSGASAYQWDFGGTDQSALENPVYVYQDTGAFTISLTAFDSNLCSKNISKQLFVYYQLLDIFVLDAHAVIDNDNFLTIVVDLANYGTRPIHSIDFIISIDGASLNFKENWTGFLDIAGVMSYTLKNNPQLSSNSSGTYVCVKAVNPNYLEDSNPNNNEACDNFNDDQFVLPSPYPNPASGNITLPFIISSDEQVSMIVYNWEGREIVSYKINATKGFNKIVLDTETMASGIYAYKLIYGEKSLTNKFIKLHND